MAKWDFIKNVGKVLSHDAVPAEKGLNRAALAQLKAEKEAEEALAAQLAAGSDAPLVNDQLRNSLGDLDISSLPASKQAEISGLPAVVEPNFTLKGEPTTPKQLPALSGSRDLLNPAVIPESVTLPHNLENINIPSSVTERYNKLRNIGLIGGAGIAATAAMNNAGGPPPEQAAVAPKVPEISQINPIEVAPSEEEKAILNQMGGLKAPVALSAQESAAPTPTSIDFGSGPSVASVQKLQELQEKMRAAQQNNELGRIGAAMAAGMTGQENKFEPVFNERAKRIAAEPELYQAQVAMEKEDPNSSQSQGMRSLAAAMGFPITGTASAADLEKQFPQLANIYNQRQAQAARKEMNAENRAARLQELALRFSQLKDQRSQAKELKEEGFVQGLRKEATTGALGKMYSNYQTAQRMNEALGQFKKNPSGYSDYASLMGGLKALQGDESVVREAEIRLGINSTSLQNKVKNWTDQLISGKTLQPAQREEMVRTVQTLADISRNQYIKAIQPIINQSQKRGVDPSFLVGEDILTHPEFVKGSRKDNQMEKAGIPISEQTRQLIKSRSDDENRQRLEFLKKKYGK